MPTNDQLVQMVRDMGDKQTLRALDNVLSGEIRTFIHCNSEICKGQTIGYIYSDGQVIEHITNNKKGEPISGVLSTRKRFDSNIGVRCICGNNSIVSEHEQGIIGPATPTKTDLEKIWENLQKSPTKVDISGKLTTVDNFTFEEVG